MGARLVFCVTVGTVSSRGYTLIEVAATLLLVSIVAGLGVASYRAVLDQADSGTSPVVLSLAQAESRRLLANDGFSEFPATLAGDITLFGRTVTIAESSDPDTVSVHVADPGTAVFAAGSPGGCLVLVDRLTGAPTWVRDVSLTTCSAAGVSAAALELSGGTATSPVEAVLL